MQGGEGARIRGGGAGEEGKAPGGCLWGGGVVNYFFFSGPKFPLSKIHASLVAQCSATPATVPATPPCSATPFQTTKFRCDTSREWGGKGATPKFLGGVARHRCYTCKML